MSRFTAFGKALTSLLDEPIHRTGLTLAGTIQVYVITYSEQAHPLLIG